MEYSYLGFFEEYLQILESISEDSSDETEHIPSPNVTNDEDQKPSEPEHTKS